VNDAKEEIDSTPAPFSRDEVRRLEARLRELGDGVSTERVDALNALAWEVGFHDVVRTESLAREAMEGARVISYPRGLAWGLLNSGFRDYFVGDYEATLEKTREAQATFEEIDDRGGLGNCYTGRGLAFWSLGDFERAVESLHHAIEIFRELAADEREAWALTSLGGVYENVGDLPKALECHSRALALFRASGHALGEGRALTGLGVVYQRQGLLAQALEHHFASLELAERIGNPVSTSRALNDIGTLYQAQGNLERAEEFLGRALQIRTAAGNVPARITSLLDLGRLAIERRDIPRALDLLNEALELGVERKMKPKVFRAHEALSDAYEAAGDFRRALEHHRSFQKQKEQVLGEETATKLRNLQTQLESETLEKLRNAQAKLIQSARMATLGKLAAGIAHEINTPVGVVTASADVAGRAVAKLVAELARSPELGSDSRIRAALAALESHRTTVDQAARRLSEIVSNLRRLTNLDQAELQFADFNENLESILGLVAPQWSGRIRIVRDFGTLPRVQAYHADLNQALLTLLVNAGEAIDGEGTVTVRTRSENGRVRISTEDTGRGIPEDLLDDIFDIGFTSRGSKIGLHVGLAQVKAAVDRHGGEIEVKSELDRGTTFSILLPLHQR
jgi:signal transduction histidine kinase